jgi:ATP-dependent RNA helicase HelY
VSRSPLLDLAFDLDPFQVEAIDHLLAGRSVVVAAPTGSGKTVVADHAIELAHSGGGKAFYTTPIKALSNQKYNDLVERYGSDDVGLLTGDTSVNGEAPIVVMTTEVLRNMIYAGSPTLRGLEYVILDEVHYLRDPYRGPVWEEVLVHAAPTIRFVCLSATVSNADELTEWIASLRGPTELVLSETRPVELTNLFLATDTKTHRSHLIDTLIEDRPNPEGHRFTETRRGRDRRQRRSRAFTTPRRHEVLEVLSSRDMLPAIVFVFSRAGCDEAASRLAEDRVLLTDESERHQIRSIVEAHTRHLDASERDVLRHDRFLAQLERGVAAHHAGMVPAFKEAVEACFVRGLVKVVFATETLALGINMPARAVVIERLTKFNGDTHEFLTPLEYTQLTGRAGRRGIDDRGYAIVLWSPWVRFEQVADLASSRDFVLKSVFRPSYNMAANLVRLHDRPGAHALLDRSFAQFQIDRDHRRLERRRNRVKRDLDRMEEQLEAEGIDPDKASRSAPEAGAGVAPEVADALARLEPGHVISVPHHQGTEPAAVLSVGYRSGGVVRVQLVGRSHQRHTLGVDDFEVAPAVLGSVQLPTPYLPNSGSFQHEVVRRLQRTRLRSARKRRAVQEVPQGGEGPDDSPEARRLVRELKEKKAQIARIDQRISLVAGRLSRQFDDIVGILQSRGYIAAWELTESGEMLRRIFNESDLAIAEALRTGVLDDLEPPEMAGLVSCLTYEHRGPGTSESPRLRSATLRDRFTRLETIVDEIRAEETSAGLQLTRELDTGFVRIAAGWAGGADLVDLLDDEEVTGGDFVRQVRQLIDVLGQIAGVAPSPATRSVAGRAAEALRRGVVVATAGPEATEEVPDGSSP